MNILKRSLYFCLDYPLVPLGDRPPIVEAEDWQISPEVFQTWETRKLPRRLYSEINKFRTLNPDLAFYLYDSDMRDKYMKDHWGGHKVFEPYDRAHFGQIKADIFRYAILYDRGGYYFDINKGCNLPLRQLHSADTEGLISFEGHDSRLPGRIVRSPDIQFQDHYVLQWGLGFKKGHEILRLVIDQIASRYAAYIGKIAAKPKKEIVELTGPLAFSEAVHTFANQNQMAHIRQAGIDFNGHGIFSMKGSGARYLVYPNYVNVFDKPLFK